MVIKASIDEIIKLVVALKNCYNAAQCYVVWIL